MDDWNRLLLILYRNKLTLAYQHIYWISSWSFSFLPQLIFTGEYTIAMNKSWHLGHFRCNECNISITGKQFIVKEEKPVCLECFEQRCVWPFSNLVWSLKLQSLSRCELRVWVCFTYIFVFQRSPHGLKQVTIKMGGIWFNYLYQKGKCWLWKYVLSIVSRTN